MPFDYHFKDHWNLITGSVDSGDPFPWSEVHSLCPILCSPLIYQDLSDIELVPELHFDSLRNKIIANPLRQFIPLGPAYITLFNMFISDFQHVNGPLDDAVNISMHYLSWFHSCTIIQHQIGSEIESIQGRIFLNPTDCWLRVSLRCFRNGDSKGCHNAPLLGFGDNSTLGARKILLSCIIALRGWCQPEPTYSNTSISRNFDTSTAIVTVQCTTLPAMIWSWHRFIGV